MLLGHQYGFLGPSTGSTDQLLASFLLYFAGLLNIDSGWDYAILALFTLLTIKLTGLSFKFFINGVKPMIWLILFTWFLH